jgi:hypothetical protein
MGDGAHKVASPMPVSWNQIAVWVKKVDDLRHAT